MGKPVDQKTNASEIPRGNKKSSFCSRELLGIALATSSQEFYAAWRLPTGHLSLALRVQMKFSTPPRPLNNNGDAFW
jgi:hypothetical protein